MFRTLQFQPTTQNSIAAFRTVQTARVRSSFRMFGLMALALLLSPSFAHAEAGGASSSITGTVADPTGAVVPGATVQIQNPVSRFDRSTTTDDAGKFTFPNVPLNPYHLTVNLAGFAPYAQDVDVRSAVPLVLKITLQISSTAENVTVQGEAGDLVENDPTFHTDVDRALFDRLPLESTSSQLSSLVTLASPGVAADSNGLFHGLGDHAENSFSLDGQPITDQQSKVFSNQIPLDAVQSMQVISGAPPAEYGDKTSLVIDVTTRSGLGSTTPHGDVTASYGSFGSSNLDGNFSYGGKNWGNFIAANGLDTGRFLDPPEFAVIHAQGNEENVFDRFDYVLSTADTLHLNFGYTRSWFQNPNSYDQETHDFSGSLITNPVTGAPLGPTDQRAQIQTFNIAPTWSHTISPNAILNVTGFVRRDAFNYYPSNDPFDDLGPPTLQRETVGQQRTLLNSGALANVTYTKGIHNIKAGIEYEQTFLNENDQLGIVDPTLNAPCLNGGGSSGQRLYESIAVRRRRISAEHRVESQRVQLCVLSAVQSGSVALRLDARRSSVPVCWSYRRERALDVRAGHDHEKELDLQSRDTR